ncbi:ATPase P [Bacillus coahuilensis m2-6]|uniref:heavy metal translocating P-type ATPase n=1 Tax=Bacillus coahuilensis TaxID=408580 RepID=UPI000750173A|nr:heavy metal translocating P-type ATPase [Bacillus coahuilensis]KUP09509.1 ATPase P [Bacillus coahuilensis m2-6]
MANTSQETTVDVTGMTCAACATRIEKGLNKLSGVEKATVNLALDRASIRYNPEELSPREIYQKIQDLGYDVKLEQTDYTITGMTCAACSARIEKVLNKQPGIEQATVNLALETATVHYHSGMISSQDIMKKVDDLGYKATEKNEELQRSNDHREEAIKKQQQKFIISLLLSLPLLWTMVGHFGFLSFLPLLEILINPWVQMALATPVQFFIGKQFYVGAYKALKNKSANMDVLVALGTSAAYFYSVYLAVESIGHEGHPMGLYFETSAILITLILLGKLFEARAKGRSSEAIKNLMGLQAKHATVERNGQEMILPIEEVLVGDILHVKPGERIPVDGEVTEGQSAMDESMITGESIPVDKHPGDNVIGATINKNGFIKMKATKVGKDTALAQIIKVVEDAQGSKAPIQRMADTISGVFVPIVVGIAVITFLIWFLWIDPGNFASSLEKLIAVLVIACPCALGLATPTSIMAGSGRAAEYGILFKGGEHLENTHRVTTVVVDKTGTVTNGEPVLTDVKVAGDFTEASLLQLVGSAEKSSEHPLAKAMVQGVLDKEITIQENKEFESIPGFGVRAIVNGQQVAVGTVRFMEQLNVEISTILHDKEVLESEGKTVMIVAVDSVYAGLIAVADTMRSTSKDAILRLKEMGIEVIMITGDNQRTADSIAREAGIDVAIGDVLPEGKAAEVKKLQQQGKVVAMVGDGINDAPALAVADIGMAIGTGTDVAMEAADITLIRGELGSIADALWMSKKTITNIKQNLFWAFAYNTLGIPLAALGLLAPWVAGAAMAFSSVSVVLNSLRLQRVKL